MAIAFILIASILAIVLLMFHYAKKLKAADAALAKIKQSEQEARVKIHSLETELQLSTRDPVTNLPTWLIFEDRLNQTIKESARYQLNLAILYIDIDDFRMINNALSYEVGNTVLAETAKRLKTCVRQVDSISRFSKDVFVILLTKLSKPETAAIVAQRILQALATPIEVATHELQITVSIGISIFPADGDSSASLLSRAEHAMQLAKKQGRHMYQFYQQQLAVDSQRELSLYTGFGREASINELMLYYCPVMDVRNESVFCLDALLHWQHTEMGLVKPDELEQLAEKRHKLNQISEWMLKKACKQFIQWRKVGFNPQYLGIPLFSKQLSDTHFIYRLSQIMQESEFKPEWMMLRIKEAGGQISFDVVEKAFNMLNYLGVQLAIDNVGSSGFSFRYLKNFKIRFLRLDSSLTSDIETNPQSLALVKALLSFADTLSVAVIVQDVETAGQLIALKDAGCSLLQGKHFGALLTENEVASIAIPH